MSEWQHPAGAKVAIGLGGVLARYVTCAAPSSLMRSGSPSGGGRVANRVVACPGVWPSGFFITPSMGVPRVTSTWPAASHLELAVRDLRRTKKRGDHRLQQPDAYQRGCGIGSQPGSGSCETVDRPNQWVLRWSRDDAQTAA